MEGVKRSRSLRVFAANSENDISPKRSKSARFELLDRTKLLESRAPGSRQNFRFPDSERANVVGIAAPDSASTEQFFDVEIPGALNATGAFRSRSQRVYVSELPESLQSVVAESQSARYSSSAMEDGTGLNSKSSQRFYDASKDGFEPAAEHPGTKNKNASLKRAKKSRAHRQSVPYFKLFKYADSIDILLMTVGTICAIVDGLIWPALAYVQARLVGKFASLIHSDPELAAQKISSYALILVYISIVSGLASYLEISCWMYTGERQAGRIRAKYVRAILRQNVGYFDTESSNTAAVVSSVSADTMLLQDAISEKVSNTIQNVMQMVGGLALGFYLSWRLALSIVPFLPFLVLPGLMYGRALLDLAVRIQIAYGKAGIVAEQAISSVRTVYSFVEEKRTLQTFSKYLEGTVNLGKKQGLAKGLAVGLTGQTFLAWAFAMWYGTYQFTHGMATGAEVVFCAFIILFAGLGLGSIAPNIKCMMEGCVAAYRIFEMIERVPPIDIDDHSQRTLEKVDGNLELRNVDFAYPSRIHAQIFHNFNLQIPAGRTVALVGSSGSGKSTVVALLERFYDPSAGQVLIDGVDIKNLQLKWLRNQIGLVSQEPALFATSIVANILYGKDHSNMEEVIEAAKSANAHNFISQLPDGYETQVGERGVQLSGGQKQRIAIARTMLKKPPVLLLDEATSALDAESEKVVQQALEAAAVGRTTVVVAHRLSTVRNADTIAVLQFGKVVEMGSHTELMARGPGGAYCALVNLQASSEDVSGEGTANGHKGLLGNEETVRTSLGVPDKRNSYQRQSSMSDQDTVETYMKQGSNLNTAIKQQMHEPQANVSLMRLLKLNRPEWKEGLLGFLGAIGFGFTNPFFAFIVASLTSNYYAGLSHEELWHKVKTYISVLVSIFVFFLTTNIVQHYYFAVAGEYLTKRTREHMLSSILSFEVGWFDRDANSSGSVCSRLASDANMVRALIGDRISLVTGALSMVVVSWVICFIVSWRFGVLVIFLHPLIIFCYYIKKALLMSFAKKTAIAQARASQVASEAVAQHRTVTAFSAQEKVVLLFKENLAGPRKAMMRRSQVAGITFGMANFCAFGSMALLYWYGGFLSKKGLASFEDFFKVFLVFVNTSRTIGEAGALAPDIAKASVAINAVFEIIDRKTEIDADVVDAEKLTKVEGRVELKNVSFAYPSRPDIMVLKGFNLKVQAGRSAAMVGQSGSGKSTIIGLLERFYDPLQGAVFVDGRNLKTMNLQSVRLHIALVSQEPTLFAMSIHDNIAYGKEGATEAEIIEAARAANAHNFISAMPEGYATFAGDRGLQLSGGQKQRIAIARAILKNPKILLLDEATSALDAESEQVVQEALDRMMVGRTTLIVAHRLSTIQNADTIAVLEGGVILEQGRHAELLSKGVKGAYYNLVHLQTATH